MKRNNIVAICATLIGAFALSLAIRAETTYLDGYSLVAVQLSTEELHAVVMYSMLKGVKAGSVGATIAFGREVKTITRDAANDVCRLGREAYRNKRADPMLQGFERETIVYLKETTDAFRQGFFETHDMAIYDECW